MKKILLLLFIGLFCLTQFSFSQSQNKYPSVLWEITGNGLKKPSYLFGTMHVSNKLAFHLSDSFYIAMRKVDMVALELNPNSWQDQMVRLEELNTNFTNYSTSGSRNDYVSENTFRILKQDNNIKMALASEPPVVNNLLYRTYKEAEDFQEDTFLDLYIFQTGRKLGKQAGGVEDYFESERLVMEAYADMAKEKNRKEIDLDGENYSSINEKVQDAYRAGNLDLMDSLDNLLQTSKAFNEKFLYKRNEIQANSIDSIIQKMSLFVGVGAAHLPGERGVIELLRKKGYNLRPIKMANRDATQKEAVEKMRVKVNFSKYDSPDGFYSVQVPGKMYSLSGYGNSMNRVQYADMDNGSYYMVSRVRTYFSFLDENAEENILKKVDSMLYENIPGKIISKTKITKNGYSGFDISNRTRNGNLQRYQIFSTPFEVIIFKMSGTNEYVKGTEAEQFFNSIQLKEEENKPVNFAAKQGYKLNLPQNPSSVFVKNISSERWEFEARNKAAKESYIILQTPIYNYLEIDADTLALNLMEESFRSPDYFDKQISRRFTDVKGFPALLVREKLQNGNVVNAAYIVNGAQQLVIAKRSKNIADSSFAFINSFDFIKQNYSAFKPFVDTFMQFKVTAPAQPQIDESIRTLIEQSADDAVNGNNSGGYITYWPKERTALLINDSTAEQVLITVQPFPKYYSMVDSTKYWKSKIVDFGLDDDLYLKEKRPVVLENGSKGYYFAATDTGSARLVERIVVIKNNYSYTITALGSENYPRSPFVDKVFSSFEPQVKNLSFDTYQSKVPLLFEDLFSGDSALHKFALNAIPSINFPKSAVPLIFRAIDQLSITDKDYFSAKTKLITELGFVKDYTSDDLPEGLAKLYQQTADTIMFQSAIVKALAQIKTVKSYNILKGILMDDTPIFDNSSDYDAMFRSLEDSLALTNKVMMPKILELNTLTDYKDNINDLLVSLIDSGFVKKKDYKKYFPGMYIDAKVELKKQRARDEKKMKEDKNKEDDPDGDDYAVTDYSYNSPYSYGSSTLYNHSVLMMPFYDDEAGVRQFFDKLLTSRDPEIQMMVASMMLKNKKNVPDSLFLNLAKSDENRIKLFNTLEEIKRLDKFPIAYKNSESLAKSLMTNEFNKNTLDTMVLIGKSETSFKENKGTMFFYKYKLKKEDDWKIGLSGLLPVENAELKVIKNLAVATGKKIKEYEPLEQQFADQMKKAMYKNYRTAAYFYNDSNYGYGYGMY